MLKIRVIQTFKKGNKIIGYRIQDISNNKVMNVETLHLKRAIIDKKCEAVNMTLTTDGRLVQHKEYSMNSTNKSVVDKYSSTIASVKQRFDKILDIYKDNKFTEITGKTGGDTITYRVYSDGTITER